MSELYYICMGSSAGIVIGFVIGGFKFLIQRNSYSKKRVEAIRRFVNWIGTALKYSTFLLLLLGFIWCVYFLILGIAMPEQSDYANNMAELIVAVLTVISILFAFIEFIRRKNEKD